MFFYQTIVQSQCTGTDGAVTICDKEMDPNYQTFNLFNHLNGTPNTGGTWSVQNPVIKNNLTTSTGIVNFWAISQFGDHVFTYTHPNCSETSNVTVSLGGYPGEDNIAGGANTCSSNSAVDLFNFLDNNLTNLNADLNGTWSPDIGTASGFLSESIFNASAAGPGTYTFVYTVDAVDTCSEKSAKVTIEVHRAPEPGEAINITICSSVDLSIYSSLDLFDYLTEEDSNGIWTDIDVTGQITALNDSEINIEEIFNNFGIGEYSFDYTVYPTHGTCSEETTSVRVKIADISSNFSAANQCSAEPLTFEIQYQNPNSVSINYDLEYEIIDSNNSIAFSDKIIGIQIDNTTTILPNVTLPSGKFTIRTKEITNIQGDTCSEFNVSEDTFVIFDTQINIPDICYDSDLIDATITNMLDINGNQLTGDQLVNYTILNVTSNEESVITNQNVSFTDGEGELTIDLSSHPITDTQYTVSFNDADGNGLGCINQDFTARRNPKITGVFSVENQCSGNPLIINIEHQRDHSIAMTYDLEYEILDQNNNPVITEIESNINISDNSNNIQNHQINLTSSYLSNGLYKIRTKQSTNVTAIECNDFTVSEDTFAIFNAAISIPDICYENNDVEATITNLTDSNGILSNSTQLVNYTITDLTTNEESVVTNESINFINGKAVFSLDMSSFPKNNYNYNITFSTTPKDGTNCIDQNFTVRRKPNDISLALNIDNSCDANDIEVIINAPTLSNGKYTISYSITSLTTNEVLTSFEFDSTGNSNFNIDIDDFDKDIYEVVLQSTQNDTTPCRVETEFEVRETFSIGGIPEKLVLDSNQSFCLPDYAPNLPTLSDIQFTQGTNVTWYENQTSNTPITSNTALTDGVTYYASSTNTNNNCESSDRSIVTVSFVDPIDVTSNNTTPIFCATSIPTIADLEATANSGIVVWYDSPTGGNQLSSTVLLINGTSYYAVENNNGCEGSNRLMFTVVVLATIKPNYSGETELCAFEKLTLFDIESDFLDYFNGQLTWFDSPNWGNTVNSSNLIEESITYYVTNVDETSGCESERIPLTFSLKNCSEKDYDFFIPDGFSPNGDSINDHYFIPNIKYYYPKYTYEIFNRYGQSLFKGDINNPKWTGKNSSSGNDVTSGVYFYILHYNQGNKAAKQGRIYLSK